MRTLALCFLVVFAAGCSKKREQQPAPPPAAAPAPKEAASAITLSAPMDVPAVAPAVSIAAAAVPKPRSLSGKKVLHVGDSMVGGHFGLTRALEGKLAEEGAKIVRHTTVSESLNSFDKGPTLRDLIRTHDPDIVIINLGANDELSPYPQTYAHSVSNITKRVGDRECWWIGPPSWKGPDTGLVKVIADNVGKCHFFDSTKLELERASDGIHPNDSGAAKWADAFWKVFRDAETTTTTTATSN